MTIAVVRYIWCVSKYGPYNSYFLAENSIVKPKINISICMSYECHIPCE